MPLHIPADYYQVSFVMSVPNNQEAICTCGWLYGGSTFEADAALLSQYWMQALGGELSNYVGHRKTFFAVEEGTVLEVSESTSGSKTGDPLPANCAWLITKVTTAPGRKNKGRFFLPMPIESNVDQAGGISSGIVSDMQDALDSFLAAAATADWIPVILHNSSDPGPTPISSFRAETKIATQRRRLR